MSQMPCLGALAFAVLAFAGGPAQAAGSFIDLGPGAGAAEPVHYRHDRTSPSVVRVVALPRSSYYRGTGVFANAQGSAGGLPVPAFVEREPGPRIVNVASARLDRQPSGPAGFRIDHSGATKIIRLSPGMGARSEARAEPQPDEDRRAFAARALQEPGLVVYPDPEEPAGEAVPVPEEAPAREAAVPEEVPVPEAAEVPAEPAEPERIAEPSPGFEPWTQDWLRDCVERHETFDASLGTYTDETGRRRFCTGE
ncbi:hypothetical protein [Aureimonas populi]|uniref:Lectin-like protein BA14k n=1 Tax=Aureimonas populi TaxID=1701758 RepID=A0ABW5CH54_9HYPH|nr:hypothetical protein [Aureimonas populi]